MCELKARGERVRGGDDHAERKKREVEDRNLTAIVAGYDTVREKRKEPAVVLFTVPFFHVYGFSFSQGAIMLSETMVVSNSA